MRMTVSITFLIAFAISCGVPPHTEESAELPQRIKGLFDRAGVEFENLAKDRMDDIKYEEYQPLVNSLIYEATDSFGYKWLLKVSDNKLLQAIGGNAVTLDSSTSTAKPAFTHDDLTACFAQAYEILNSTEYRFLYSTVDQSGGIWTGQFQKITDGVGLGLYAYDQLLYGEGVVISLVVDTRELIMLCEPPFEEVSGKLTISPESAYITARNALMRSRITKPLFDDLTSYVRTTSRYLGLAYCQPQIKELGIAWPRDTNARLSHCFEFACYDSMVIHYVYVAVDAEKNTAIDSWFFSVRHD